MDHENETGSGKHALYDTIVSKIDDLFQYELVAENSSVVVSDHMHIVDGVQTVVIDKDPVSGNVTLTVKQYDHRVGEIVNTHFVIMSPDSTHSPAVAEVTTVSALDEAGKAEAHAFSDAFSKWADTRDNLAVDIGDVEAEKATILAFLREIDSMDTAHPYIRGMVALSSGASAGLELRRKKRSFEEFKRRIDAHLDELWLNDEDLDKYESIVKHLIATYKTRQQYFESALERGEVPIKRSELYGEKDLNVYERLSRTLSQIHDY